MTRMTLCPIRVIRVIRVSYSFGDKIESMNW